MIFSSLVNIVQIGLYIVKINGLLIKFMEVNMLEFIMLLKAIFLGNISRIALARQLVQTPTCSRAALNGKGK